MIFFRFNLAFCGLLCNIFIQFLLVVVQIVRQRRSWPSLSRSPAWESCHSLSQEVKGESVPLLPERFVLWSDAALNQTDVEEVTIIFKTKSAPTWRVLEVLHIKLTSWNMTAVQNVDKFF